MANPNEEYAKISKSVIPKGGDYKAYSDASFVTGDSPATHDFNDDTGAIAKDGYIQNSGSGALTFAISEDGTTFGDEIYLGAGQSMRLDAFLIDQIRVTWVADTAYSILLI